MLMQLIANDFVVDELLERSHSRNLGVSMMARISLYVMKRGYKEIPGIPYESEFIHPVEGVATDTLPRVAAAGMFRNIDLMAIANETEFADQLGEPIAWHFVSEGLKRLPDAAACRFANVYEYEIVLMRYKHIPRFPELCGNLSRSFMKLR